jgi:phosphoribosylformimino-5-aminoimidazole carboxamide ribonucleotide (ProFAR) isomerase
MERDTVFCDSPVEQALAWQSQGAELLHLVDLNGALPVNRKIAPPSSVGPFPFRPN